MKGTALKLCAITLALAFFVPASLSIRGTEADRHDGANEIFNSTPTAVRETEILTPENQAPTAVIGDLITGYTGRYYNLPADHPDVEGEVTGAVPGDTPFNHDWYDDQYFSFERNDMNLTFGSSWFPVDEGLEGDPQYFAVHWQANITVPADGEYSFLMGSDDDSWLYIDDIMVIDLGGIHALEEDVGTVNLTAGEHPLNIYFAERHVVQSGFYFEFLDEQIEIAYTVIWDDIEATINEPVSFEGGSSFDVDGTIETYEWNFGDVTAGTGTTPEHTYSESGTFTVTLTVTDDDGAQGSDTCLVSIVNEAPVADAGNDKTVYRFEDVYFDGSGSYDNGGAIADYSWNFGDGAIGAGISPVHSYSQAGEYTVTLTVTDDDGACASDSCTVNVLELPDIDYSIEYLDYLDQTMVDAAGIHFFTSGAYPGLYHSVLFNETFVIPASDYGTYPLYNSSMPLHFAVTIINNNDLAISNIGVRATQERHNDMTIWDRFGPLTLYKGQAMEGNSISSWVIDSLAPGETITLQGVYWFQGRGWGLDQTHLTITTNGTTIVNDPEAGVYCPP